MRNHKWMYSILCIFSAFSIGFLQTGHASCIQSVQNNSHADWIFTISTQNTLTFTGAPCYAKEQCTIKPGQQIVVEFPRGGSGYITLMDTNRQAATFAYEAGMFSCNHIFHNGATGGVTVNEPKSGDLVIEQDTWGKVIGHYAKL